MSDIVLTLWESSLKGVVREAKFTRLCFGRTYVYVLTHACVLPVCQTRTLWLTGLKENLWHEILLLCVSHVKNQSLCCIKIFLILFLPIYYVH